MSDPLPNGTYWAIYDVASGSTRTLLRKVTLENGTCHPEDPVYMMKDSREAQAKLYAIAMEAKSKHFQHRGSAQFSGVHVEFWK